MAYIEVDHSEFEKTASSIDKYIRDMKSKMRLIDSCVDSVARNWEGQDSVNFQGQWDTVTAKDSTYSNMVNDLESYANFLRTAGNKYKEVQANAVNRAILLTKW